MSVRMLKEELQLLQEPGSYVGEVVKVMGKSKVLVKVSVLPLLYFGLHIFGTSLQVVLLLCIALVNTESLKSLCYFIGDVTKNYWTFQCSKTFLFHCEACRFYLNFKPTNDIVPAISHSCEIEKKNDLNRR